MSCDAWREEADWSCSNGDFVITDLFDSGTGERSVEPTLQRQLRRGLRHGSKCNSALPIARYNTSMTADAKSSVPALPP